MGNQLSSENTLSFQANTAKVLDMYSHARIFSSRSLNEPLLDVSLGSELQNSFSLII